LSFLPPQKGGNHHLTQKGGKRPLAPVGRGLQKQQLRIENKRGEGACRVSYLIPLPLEKGIGGVQGFFWEKANLFSPGGGACPNTYHPQASQEKNENAGRVSFGSPKEEERKKSFCPAGRKEGKKNAGSALCTPGIRKRVNLPYQGVYGGEETGANCRNPISKKRKRLLLIFAREGKAALGASSVPGRKKKGLPAFS